MSKNQSNKHTGSVPRFGGLRLRGWAAVCALLLQAGCDGADPDMGSVRYDVYLTSRPLVGGAAGSVVEAHPENAKYTVAYTSESGAEVSGVWTAAQETHWRHAVSTPEAADSVCVRATIWPGYQSLLRVSVRRGDAAEAYSEESGDARACLPL